MTVLLTAALLLPFTAHSTAELADWHAEWLATPETSDIKVELLRDMEARHPCFPEACLAAVTKPLTGASVVAAAPTPPPGVEQWRTMVASFWPAEHVDRMLRIAQCESHGDPGAVNPSSGAAGLFQIMPFWQKVWPGDYFDPWTNTAVAYQIWLTQGYGAWVCRG